MKKLFLALFFAVLGFASMAQTITVNQNVRGNNGKLGMQVHVNYSITGSGSADMIAYINDVNGNPIKCDAEYLCDEEGNLCSFLENQKIGNGSYSCNLFFPYDVIGEIMGNGTYQVEFVMYKSESGDVVMNVKKNFTLNWE